MTVASTFNKATYQCDGAVKDYPFTFRLDAAEDLVVYLVDPDGVVSQLSTNLYVVSGADADGRFLIGGTVTTNSAYAEGYKIVLFRNIEILQQLDLVNAAAFKAEVLEGTFDRIVMMIQQHEEALGRTFKVGLTDDEDTTPDAYIASLQSYVEAASTSKDAAEAAQSAAEAAQSAAEAAQSAAETAEANAVAAAQVFIGTPVISFTDTKPDSAVWVDGSELPVATEYDALNTYLNGTYGIGPGGRSYLPDPQGLFLRVVDGAAGVDPDAATRTDRGDGTAGDNVGTKQTHNLMSHDHYTDAYSGAGAVGTNLSNNHTGYNDHTTPHTSATGGSETRPSNMNVRIYMYYK